MPWSTNSAPVTCHSLSNVCYGQHSPSPFMSFSESVSSQAHFYSRPTYNWTPRSFTYLWANQRQIHSAKVTLHITPTGTSTCPVKALHEYTSMILKDHQTGPFYSAGTFNSLTRPKLSTILRRLLQLAGYNPTLYCTNSFRIGAATTLATAPWLIKTLGWWNSDAYLSYIQALSAERQRASSINLGKDHNTWRFHHLHSFQALIIISLLCYQ